MRSHVNINEINFKKILDGTRHAVAKDNARPALQYIKISVASDRVIAFSCDRYRGARIEIPAQSDTGFQCFIKPFDFKLSKSKTRTVTLTFDDFNHTTEVDYPTTDGTAHLSFVIPTNYPDIEKFFSDARNHDRNLGVNETYVIEACKALSCVTPKMAPIVIQTKENNKATFLIVGGDDKCKCEQMILPIRLSEKYDL